MQTVPDEIRKCVVFIACKVGNELVNVGSGFFVTCALQGTDKSLLFLVTAKHILIKIEKDSTDKVVYIRVNGQDGKVKLVKTKLSDWKYHPSDSSADCAALPVFDDVQKEYDFLAINIDLMAKQSVIEKLGIGAGEEVFITGLFTSHYGKSKNLPIVRTGNIAMMPEEKVVARGFGPIDAYLIEARSIGGLSGSPVFVYVGFARQTWNRIKVTNGHNLFYWLGLMHGHWDIKPEQVEGVGSGENSSRVNMGIGIVVPVERISETLQHHSDQIMKERKENGLEVFKVDKTQFE